MAQETKTKMLQVLLPEMWVRHLDTERGKRGLQRRQIVMQALRSFLGEPIDYDAELAKKNRTAR